jgi:RNA 2',3'-cyclic 3'-phosphodiesterase
MPTTRTFVALNLPPEARASAADLRRALSPAPRGLRWAATDQLHLTLAFLGDVDDEDLAAVRAATRSAAAAHAPFDADLRGLGAFPHPGRARVAWAGWGAGAEAVTALQATLARALAGPADRRPFSPHVTLARARDPLDLRTWLASAPAWTSPAWRVDALDVMMSELTREGAIHTLVERCALAGDG